MMKSAMSVVVCGATMVAASLTGHTPALCRQSSASVGCTPISRGMTSTGPQHSMLNRFNHGQSSHGLAVRTNAHTTAFLNPVYLLGRLGYLASNPYASAFAVCAVKGATADYLAQRSQFSSKASSISMQRKRLAAMAGANKKWAPWRGGGDVTQCYQHDYKRQLAFLLYSGFYQGMALEYIYNTLFTQWFGPHNALLKVIASMLVLAPFVTLPIAYLVKAVVLGQGVGASLRRYADDVTHRGLLQTFWSIWIPVQTMAFVLVPKQFRISFLAAASFLWMIVFSRISTSSS